MAVHPNMAFDPLHLLAGIETLVLGRVGATDALRVNNQKARVGFAALSATHLAILIILKPTPGRWVDHQPWADSRSENSRGRCATSGSPSATSAIGNRS